MPTWHDFLNDIQAGGSIHDRLRRKCLARLHRLTKRNVIVYYSDWLQSPGDARLGIDDADKAGFMTVIHGLDKSKGLDLILHTPGGQMGATESLVEYLRSIFGTDIRAIVPQIAMSAGTMIACACNKIIMGKHSNLGPIDPFLGNLPTHGVVEEFNRAHKEIKEDPTRAAVWQPIIAKYPPTLVGECEKAIKWASEMTQEWLLTGMLSDMTSESEREKAAKKIVDELSDHSLTQSHDRHLGPDRCRKMGLAIELLEDDPSLQEAVLSVHHMCILTLSATNAQKITENHKGIAHISMRARP